MIKSPVIYIDTNICRDCIKTRRPDSIHLMNIIRDRKWKCISAIFTLLELFDIEKEDLFFHKKHRQGWEINKILRQRYHKEFGKDDLQEITQSISMFHSTYRFIEWYALDNSGWSQTVSTCSNSSLTASDIIHLEVAWEKHADIIVTSDEDFIKNGNKFLKEEKIWKKFRICKPTDAIKVLKQMKFKITN